MRKIFTFLFAALMSVGMFAATEVTITNSDFPKSGNSFTKYGVTVSAGNIDGTLGNLMMGGSFSTTLGNFTKIEVTANGESISGPGWAVINGKKTWKGNAASSVSFGGNIMGNGQGVTLKFTIAEPTVAVTGVTLNQNEAQMTVGGETLTLTATVNPNNATDQSVSWSTSDANVATVENGVVTAVAAGNATITVTTTDGSFTATCAVTVTAAEPNSITINGTPQVGDNSISLTYYFDPANVPGICCNAPTLKVKCAADNQWDEIWLSLINISSGTTTITLDELGSFQEGKSYDVCFAYNNGSWVDDVFQSFTPAAATPEPEPQPEDVNITPNVDPDHAGVYYSTFYDSANKYALPAGVEAYIVTTVSGDAMQLQKVADAGQTIPAGAGVILKSSVTPFTLTLSDADAVSIEGNRLEGSDISTATPANCYVLSCENNLVGFYHYIAGNLNAHKAYIIYSGSNQAPRRLRFVFDQATGVENVQGNVQSTKVFRDGQLVIIRNGVEYNAAGQMVK